MWMPYLRASNLNGLPAVAIEIQQLLASNGFCL